MGYQQLIKNLRKASEGESIKVFGKPLGYKICPAWLHLVYRKAVNFKCKRCKRHEDRIGTLSPHRIKRKTKGGLYTVVPLNHKDNNVIPCCNYAGEIDGKISCHKLFHANDSRVVKTK